MMLEHAANVREVIAIVGAHWLSRIDFDSFQVTKTSFVRRDFRHVESDIVCTARLLGPDGKKLRKQITIYILIEHQSQPDALMPMRLVDYVTQINNHQLRQWSKTHQSAAGFRLHPVLPIVLYTGTRSWKSLGTLADMTEFGEDFAEVLPIIQRPLFLNLPVTDGDTLDAAGAFGAVLHLIRDRNQSREKFQSVLSEVVQQLELLPDEQRLRWLELLSYVHAMIYHARPMPEQSTLYSIVEESVQTDPQRQEVSTMAQTMAEFLEARGAAKGEARGEARGELRSLQKTLQRLLERRFGEVSDSIRSTISATVDVAQLEDWLDRFAIGESLEELRIGE